jgi:mitochondrial fission protein ELM1
MNWLVTTSPRTAQVFEKKMQNQMKTKMFVAYHQNQKKIVDAFLTLAEMVYVTEESASMISEAIASHKPVVAMSPKKAEPDSNYEKILKKFEEKKRLKRVSIDELRNIHFSVNDFSLIEKDSIHEIADKLSKVVRTNV